MRIHWREETESTNIDARAGAHGDVFVADFQHAGRGRLDHVWKAARGENLTFSVVLSGGGKDPADVATLPLVVGLAVLRGAERMLGSSGVRLSLKWPNDVLVSGRKLAGILCERLGEDVIAGIGLNVNQTQFPPDIEERATSLALLDGRAFDRKSVLSFVLEELESCPSQWMREGFAALHPAIRKVDCLEGRIVSVRQTDSDSAPLIGECEGIGSDGTLLVAGRSVAAGEAHIESAQ